MMKKGILFLIILSACIFLQCAGEMNFIKNVSGENIEVPAARKDMNGDLLGMINKDVLFKDFPAFRKSYDAYSVDSRTAEQLKKIKNIDVLIVLGTWCKDSKKHVGEFLKLVDAAGLDWNIFMIGIHRQKTYPQNIIEKFHIEKVPTFIFYENRNELGRIIEHPVNSLEQDAARILNKMEDR